VNDSSNSTYSITEGSLIEAGVPGTPVIIESKDGHVIENIFSSDCRSLFFKNNRTFCGNAPPNIEITPSSSLPPVTFSYTSGFVVSRSTSGSIDIAHAGDIIINSAIDLRNLLSKDSDLLNIGNTRATQIKNIDVTITSAMGNIVINSDLYNNGKTTVSALQGSIVIGQNASINSISDMICIFSQSTTNNGKINTPNAIVFSSSDIQNSGHIHGQYVVAPSLKSDGVTGSLITQSFYRLSNNFFASTNTVNFSKINYKSTVSFSNDGTGLKVNITSDINHYITISSDSDLNITCSNSNSIIYIKNPSFDLMPFLNTGNINISTPGSVIIETLQASGCFVTVTAAEITVKNKIDVSGFAGMSDAFGGNIQLISSEHIYLGTNDHPYTGSLLANGGGEFVPQNLLDYVSQGGIEANDGGCAGSITVIALGNITQVTQPDLSLADWLFIQQQQQNFVNYIFDIFSPSALEYREWNQFSWDKNTFFDLNYPSDSSQIFLKPELNTGDFLSVAVANSVLTYNSFQMIAGIVEAVNSLSDIPSEFKNNSTSFISAVLNPQPSPQNALLKEILGGGIASLISPEPPPSKDMTGLSLQNLYFCFYSDVQGKNPKLQETYGTQVAPIYTFFSTSDLLTYESFLERVG